MGQSLIYLEASKGAQLSGAKRSLPVTYRFSQSFWQVMDWVFPPSCAGCGQPGARWCADCVNSSSRLPIGMCALCQKQLPKSGEHDCARMTYLDQAFSWGWHQGPLRQAVHKLKYQRDLGLAHALALHLVETIEENHIVGDLIVPVPLGRKRKNSRGYNQAALLAKPFAARYGLHYLANVLTRTRETPTQVGLSVEERRLNVAGAFSADSKHILGKNIILVDDVLTTGATLNAAAEALKEAGAARVSAVVLARAVGINQFSRKK